MKKLVVPQGSYTAYAHAWADALLSGCRIVEEGAGDFSVAAGTLVAYFGDGGDVAVPDGVTAIGEAAFLGTVRK